MPILSASAGEKPFPKRVPTMDGSYHEGFAIGMGTTAYSGSPDGSIYKVDLRNGQGEILVNAGDPNDCVNLGMRVDRRTNSLFVAGCFYGNAYVYDPDAGGEPIMEYQLDHSGSGLINDLAITQEGDTTTLHAPLPDQTVLHSVLDRIRDMNVPLISVNKIVPDGEASNSKVKGAGQADNASVSQ